MGGMVALAFVGRRRYPERVDGLVLDCASAESDFMARATGKSGSSSPGRTGWAASNSRSRSRRVSFPRVPRHAAGPETVKDIQGVLGRNCAVSVFAGACDAMATMDVRPLAARVTAPTLVMTGSEDA